MWGQPPSAFQSSAPRQLRVDPPELRRRASRWDFVTESRKARMTGAPMCNELMKRRLACLLFAPLTFYAQALPGQKPKDATEWFQRAADQMNLRAFGSTPFHMKVTFHAFPGIVLSKKESDQIISGDGTYEETWFEPHKWRREVTFGSYHAIEVESEAGRKMQASSDYEPSRVLMLLEALFYPIPRTYSSPLRMGQHLHWKIRNGAVGGQSYVMIGSDDPAYLFSSSGELLQTIYFGIVTDFMKPSIFHGRLFAQHIQAHGGNKQDLVSADVAVEPARPIDAAAFTLPGRTAEPGMTLRPLDFADYNFPYTQPGFLSEANGPLRPVGKMREIIDRNGVVHELEVLYSPNPKNFEPVLPLMRGDKFHHSPTIDKSPCEIAKGIIMEPNN